MKIGVLQFDVSHEVEKNLDCLKFYLGKNKCDVLILPELSVCGYLFQSRKDLYMHAELVPDGITTRFMLTLTKEYSCTIIFGIAEKEGQNIFNTAVIVSKGKFIGKYRKIHLSDLEKKIFDRGDENKVFNLDGLKIGVQICFDLWFPEISREQIRMGAEILFVLANFGGDTTYQISKVRAIENLTPLVLCNRVGTEFESGIRADFLGKSTAIDAKGNRIFVAPEKVENFKFCEIELTDKRSNLICGDFDGEIAFHYPQTHLFKKN